MIRGKSFSTTAKLALSAAIFCSAPASFAQDVAAPPPVMLPVPEQVAAPSVIAPPPVVPTIPENAMDEPAPAVTAPKVVAKRSATRAVAKPAVKSAQPSAMPSTNAINESDDAVTPASDIVETAPTVSTVEDTAKVALLDQPPIDRAAATQIVDGTDDDWMTYGGLGAALALAGLGGLLASRRRRNKASELARGEPTVLVPTAVASMQSARPMSVKPSFAPAERHTTAVSTPSFADRHLPPVTDPLFSHQATLTPVTDPLFAHKTVMPPVTDPLFADKDEYVGRSSGFDKRSGWPAASTRENPIVREYEPAE